MPPSHFTLPTNPELPTGDVRTIVERLSAFSGVRRIWLFGGRIKRPETIDFRSDLDVAVEGLQPGDHARAWARLDADTSLPIDLVRWEEAPPLLRDQIRATGILVYESVA